MDFKKLLETDDDERAVSPVIGVILMVAITVILAAVIGAFVIGIGGDQEVTPTASFDINFESNGNGTVTHSTGDTIEAPESLDVVIDGEDNDWVPSQNNVSAGSTYDLDDSQNGKAGPDEWAGETINIVWTSETEESSATLSSSEAPDET